eukprot:11408347-Karenia_brevis.AAC.1
MVRVIILVDNNNNSNHKLNHHHHNLNHDHPGLPDPARPARLGPGCMQAAWMQLWGLVVVVVM